MTTTNQLMLWEALQHYFGGVAGAAEKAINEEARVREQLELGPDDPLPHYQMDEWGNVWDLSVADAMAESRGYGDYTLSEEGYMLPEGLKKGLRKLTKSKKAGKKKRIGHSRYGRGGGAIPMDVLESKTAPRGLLGPRKRKY